MLYLDFPIDVPPLLNYFIYTIFRQVLLNKVDL